MITCKLPLDSFIDENPTNPFGRELKIDVLLHKKSIEPALEEYGKYVKLTGDNSPSLLRKIMKNSLSGASDITEYLMSEEYTTKSNLGNILTDILLDFLNTDELERDERVDALTALGIIKSEKALLHFAKIAKDTNEEEWVRLRIISLISKFGGQEAIDALRPLLTDSLQSIRLETAERLIGLGNFDGKDILISYALNNIRNGTDQQQIKSAKLLGEIGETKEAKDVLLDIFNDFHSSRGLPNRKLVDAVILSLIKLGYPSESLQPPRAITVEVLNACCVHHPIGHDFREYLRSKNFDVVNVGNYSIFDLEQTYVLDRVALNNTNAEKVAYALGVEKKQVLPRLENSGQAMVTVLVGKDYKSLKVYNSNR